MQKTALADNESWVDIRNRNQNSVRNRSRSKQSFKRSGVTDEESGAVDTGHWMTEKTGKRVRHDKKVSKS